MLVGAAGEVQQQPLAVDHGAQAQHEVALRRLEHVLAVQLAVGQRREAGARAPLGVVEHGVGRLAAGARLPTRLGELGQALRAGAVGGELGAQVGPALLRLAHARDELVERRLVERPRRDHDALLLQRAAVGRHRPGHARPDVGVVRAAGGEAEQRLARREHRRDDRDVGQVGAAGERVVEDPRDARGVFGFEHRRHRRRHRAEMHRDVLGLHHHLPVGVEQRGRGVAALLDVRRVRRADQHHAHLLAGGAQRAGHDLQLDRVEWLDPCRALRDAAVRRGWTACPCCVDLCPHQPGGTSSVDSGSAHSAGPRRRVPGGSSPRSTVAVTGPPSKTISWSSVLGAVGRAAAQRARRAPSPTRTRAC